MNELFGRVSEDGTIVEDTEVCIVSGREIVAGDTMVRISGTPYFYRVAAVEQKKLTPDMVRALEAEARGESTNDEAADEVAENEGEG